MLTRFLQTDDDAIPALARLALGLVMFPHAMQKLLGWFGGYGLAGTHGFMVGTLHLPSALAWLAIAAEVLGSLGLIAGLAGRGAAFGIAAVMAGAVLSVHRSVGFFMDWSGQQHGEGYEYHLLAISLALIVMVRGSGAWSLDRLLGRRTEAAPAAAAAPMRLAA